MHRNEDLSVNPYHPYLRLYVHVAPWVMREAEGSLRFVGCQWISGSSESLAQDSEAESWKGGQAVKYVYRSLFQKTWVPTLGSWQPQLTSASEDLSPSSSLWRYCVYTHTKQTQLKMKILKRTRQRVVGQDTWHLPLASVRTHGCAPHMYTQRDGLLQQLP